MGVHMSVRWCRPLWPVMRICCVLAFALAVAACSDAPANPAAPLPVPVTVQTVAVRIEGKVVDADSGEGISGARVGFAGGWMMSGNQFRLADTIPLTDQSGSFVLEWMLPVGWREFVISVARDNFLGTKQYVTLQGVTNGGVVRLYPERTIRPGESLDTQVSVRTYVCGFESWMCRKIFVDISGGPVDLELIPLDGQGDDKYLGLVVGEPFTPTLPIARRLTVNAPEVFIYGSGRVQLRASRTAQ